MYSTLDGVGLKFEFRKGGFDGGFGVGIGMGMGMRWGCRFLGFGSFLGFWYW